MLINQIDACLPQTQCTRCGYPSCSAYAEALLHGHAEINRCPPGGEATLHALSQLTGRAPRALDPHCGVHEPRVRAFIDESICIGCRKCLDVCPVDAIVGARKRMHTVLSGECNGCGLCLPPCPVDCIVLLPVTVEHDPDSPWPEYSRQETQRWRIRAQARRTRLARRKAARAVQVPPPQGDRDRIRADIQAAVARVRAKRAKPSA